MSLVAAIQMNSAASVGVNLLTAKQYISAAADEGAKLIILPEDFAFIGKKSEDKLVIAEKEGQGRIQDFMAHQAQQYGVWIVGGTIPIKTDEDDKVYAASFVWDDKGHCVAKYNKIHLFDVIVPGSALPYCESNVILPGCETTVLETPFGKMGLSVCYDLRFPELYRKMVKDGAEILVVPSAFTQVTGKAHWSALLRARAIENQCYVIASNQSGVHENDMHHYGHSVILDPWGECLAEQTKSVGFVTAEIDLAKLEVIREDFPVLKHRVL